MIVCRSGKRIFTRVKQRMPSTTNSQPPYKDLYIYYINGRIAWDAAVNGPHFIGAWEEDGDTFLFFTHPAHKDIQTLLERHPHLTLADSFQMTYDEWQGGAIETIQVGRLQVVAPWKAQNAPWCSNRILLDPGVVFGTGTHPTTRDCLKALQSAFNSRRIHTVVDLGTGTGLLALAAGAVLVYVRGGLTLILLGLGAFFVLFYTYPLKYIALGEVAVLIVWGPLMIGGGYYVITGAWDWNVILASLPYALGVTTVIFGKHIDKYQVDKDKGIHTLPVLLGERAARTLVVLMTGAQYLLVLYLVIIGFFTPVLLVVFLALPVFFKVFLAMYRHPKPSERPEEYPADAWPLWFVATAFAHNRRFGLLFLLGLLADALLRIFILK